jgi:hypothetical protein
MAVQGLGLVHLSARAGLGVTTIGEFMRGKNDATLLTACALADVCHLKLDDYRRKWEW